MLLCSDWWKIRVVYWRRYLLNKHALTSEVLIKLAVLNFSFLIWWHVALIEERVVSRWRNRFPLILRRCHSISYIFYHLMIITLFPFRRLTSPISSYLLTCRNVYYLVFSIFFKLRETLNFLRLTLLRYRSRLKS